MTHASSATDLDGVRHDYMDALMARDSHRARAVIDRALSDGAMAGDLDIDVLQAAMNGFGDLWQEGVVSVAHEHFVTGITEGVMALLASRMRRPPVGGRLALVACAPGERHSLGARMLADFLESDGWEVLALGADTPARDLLDLARDEQPDVVAISVTMPEFVDGALELLGALRTLSPRPKVAVGGRGWPEGRSAADIVESDARLLRARLRARMPPRGD